MHDLLRMKPFEDDAPAVSPRLAVRASGRILLLKVTEIEWIEASGNYVRVHARGGSHLLRETLQGVEAKLPRDRFVRIHRSILVNAESVAELVQGPGGDLTVKLENGASLPLGRGFRERLGMALGVAL